MTRQLHDQFAKQYLEELLAPLGQVETSRDVVSRSQVPPGNEIIGAAASS